MPRARKATASRRAQGVVTVLVPPAAANDLRKFQRIQAGILDRLGCRACCSGLDIRWITAESVFTVDSRTLTVGKLAV